MTKPLSRPTRSRPRTRPPKPEANSPFAFVISTQADKPSENTRKFIRSHVMRGKNKKRRNSTHSTVLARSSSSTKDTLTTHEYGSTSAVVGPSRYVGRKTSKSLAEYRMILPPTPPQPIEPPNDLTLHRFSSILDETSTGLIWHFFAVLKESMYPVEWCFEFDREKTCWFRWLYDDEAYLQSVLFVVSAFQDLMRQQQVVGDALIKGGDGGGGTLARHFSPQTQGFLRRTIQLLQERIQDQARQLEDTTAAVIVSLALMADAVRDVEACEMHMAGLRKLVRLKGGLRAYDDNKQMQVKICRLDLGWSLRQGCKPDFFDNVDVTWDPLIENIISQHRLSFPCETSPELKRMLVGLDPKLRTVFDDLRGFSAMANSIIPSKRKLLPEHFQKIMLSIQYRLLLLDFGLDTRPWDEAVRLGLLAYQTTIFFQVKGTKLDSEYMATGLRSAISVVIQTSSPSTRQFTLWLLLMGSIVVFQGTEPWLVAYMSELLDGNEWEGVREQMKRIMWIDVVHDGPGKRAFTETLREVEATTADVLPLIL